MDSDADTIPDVSDDDADNDGVLNLVESVCGSDPLNPFEVPERVDGVFHNVDDDGDGQIDEALPSLSFSYDCDGDGFAGVIESGKPLCGNGLNDDGFEDSVADDGCPGGPPQVGSFSEGQFNIGTLDQDPCGTGQEQGGAPGGWPIDLSAVGPPDTYNKVNIVDLNELNNRNGSGPVVTPPGKLPYEDRYDIAPGPLFDGSSAWIDVEDFQALAFTVPPMLGGAVRAFNGPPCPWPP